VTAEWVRLKCQFGCDGFGQRLSCPPNTPAPEQVKRVLAVYRRALIDEHYKALGLVAGPCRLCTTSVQDCRFREDVPLSRFCPSDLARGRL